MNSETGHFDTVICRKVRKTINNSLSVKTSANDSSIRFLKCPQVNFTKNKKKKLTKSNFWFSPFSPVLEEPTQTRSYKSFQEFLKSVKVNMFLGKNRNLLYYIVRRGENDLRGFRSIFKPCSNNVDNS